MSERKRRLVETGKSVLILLLTLSALLLAVRAFWYSEAPSGGLLDRWMPTATPTAPAEPQRPGQGGVYHPVRMAVVNQNGRYGIQYDTTATDQLFQELGVLLGEALDTAGTPAPSTRQIWEEALDRTGVYFGFPGATPLPLLSSWLGGSEGTGALTGEAGRILLAQSAQGGHVVLYYVDAQTGSYYACQTAAQFGTLLDGYIPNGAAFAFQQPERYGELDPDILLLPNPPAPPLYTAGVALEMADTDQRDLLLNTLGYAPQSQSIYPTADGWSVREGTDILRLTASGTITFSAGEGEARYPVPANGRAGMVEAAGHLVSQAILPRCGAAWVYLSALIQEGEQTTLEYSYLLSGAQVTLGREGPCATFTISGGKITDYTLHLRSYAPTADTALLLPEFQAMAALTALEPIGNSLLLRYYDSGSGTVAPAWTGR